MLKLRFDIAGSSFGQSRKGAAIFRQVVLDATREFSLLRRRRSCGSGKRTSDVLNMMFKVLGCPRDLVIATLCDERVQFLDTRVRNSQFHAHLGLAVAGHREANVFQGRFDRIEGVARNRAFDRRDEYVDHSKEENDDDK